MCIGSVKAQPLPPTPPAPPTMSDPAVQRARNDTKSALTGQGLTSTQLTDNLAGKGKGSEKMGTVN